MHGCRVKHTFITLLLAIATSGPAAYAGDWYRYNSDNFAVYTDEDQQRTIRLLNEFEAFRSTALAITGLPNRPENTRLQVVVFDNKGEYESIAPENTLGFFTETLSGPRMVLGSGSSERVVTQVLYHEYTHYLLHEHSDFNYPRWYNEGFAEFLGSTRIDEGRATIGEVPFNRNYTLALDKSMSVEELIDPSLDRPDSIEFQSRFYAYAWFLTHYLQITALTDKPELGKQLQEYLRRYNSGEDSVTAFAAGFGITPKEMDAQLGRYYNSTLYATGHHRASLKGLVLSVPGYQGQVTRKKLGDNEAVFLRAELASALGEVDVAKEYLDKTDPGSIGAAQSLSLLAVLQNHDGKLEQASVNASRALALAPGDARVLANLSHWEWDNYERALQDGADGDKALALSLSYGQDAIERDPENLEPYDFVWRAQYAKGDNVAAARTLMQAYQVLPSSAGINYTIGDFLINIGKPELARPFLQRVSNWSHSASTREKIAGMLAGIDPADGGEGSQESDTPPATD